MFTSFFILCLTLSLSFASITPLEFLSLRTYHNYKNSIIKYEFSIQIDGGLTEDEILSLTWPYALHSANKNEVKMTLLKEGQILK
jgi:hypothetical protein